MRSIRRETRRNCSNRRAAVRRVEEVVAITFCAGRRIGAARASRQISTARFTFGLLQIVSLFAGQTGRQGARKALVKERRAFGTQQVFQHISVIAKRAIRVRTGFALGVEFAADAGFSTIEHVVRQTGLAAIRRARAASLEALLDAILADKRVCIPQEIRFAVRTASLVSIASNAVGKGATLVTGFLDVVEVVTIRTPLTGCGRTNRTTRRFQCTR